MLSFLPGAAVFAVAGLIAAAGPILIHLLNRRRYRVVQWAAMDFLREALQRNRRMMRVRDLLLLALRTAAVLLFGLALARPYFSQSAAAVDPDGPLHAVLIVDNSLSMGYQRLNGTLLDEAKARAEQFIESLPARSRISIVPLCGAQGGFSRDPYRTKEDALAALEKIQVVDRSASAAVAADLAWEACQQATDMPASSKRVVFLGDQQLVNWPSESLAASFKKLPGIQVVDISARDAENTWVSDLRVQDGIADVETNATFVATVRHDGASPREDVPVTLAVDGIDARTILVDLEPGQEREVVFEDYRFDNPPEAGRSSFVPAKVTLPSDRLEVDNARHVVVPVVAALPVVFVDQWGSDEDPDKIRFGETRKLRALIAPVTSRGETRDQLVEIRHVKMSELDQKLLEDARLVVLAGVTTPEPESLELLRDYVRQGGQLLIAAGAAFDPAAWTELAWLDGAGILPVPLKPQPIGQTVEEASHDLKVFGLDYESMAHEWFHPAEVAEEDLRAHYTDVKFFKAVEANLDSEIIQSLVDAELKRIEQQRRFLAEADERDKKWTDAERAGKLDETARQEWAADRVERAKVNPQWLIWSDELPAWDASLPASELAASFEPRVLARFDNDAPFLVERTIGRGQVLMVTTGVQSSWNILPHVKAMFIFDRLMRSLLERTLPLRNLESVDQVTLPVDVGHRLGRFTLTRPDGTEEVLSVEALGPEAYGLTVRNASQRGVYTVTAFKAETAADEGRDTRLWTTPIAVNGPARESELPSIDEATLSERMGPANYRWVAPGDPISLEGAGVWGQDLWWWLILAVIGCLVLELAVLAWPAVTMKREAA